MAEENKKSYWDRFLAWTGSSANDDRNKALIDAAGKGQTDEVKKLLAAGADVHASSKDYFVPGNPILGYDEQRDAALYEAAKAGHTDTVKALLAAGADVHTVFVRTGRNNFTTPEAALSAAAEGGHTDTVKLLLAAHADANAGANAGYPALARAAKGGHTETVKALLAAGADVHAGNDAALLSAAEGGHTDTVKLLLAAHADANATYAGYSALANAAYGGYNDTVKLLLAAGADINAGNGKNCALFMAADGGHPDTVKLLLAAGAAPHAVLYEVRTMLEGAPGATPLQPAVESALRMLIGAGEKAAEKDKTPAAAPVSMQPVASLAAASPLTPSFKSAHDASSGAAPAKQEQTPAISKTPTLKTAP
jgi:ankyrin repeat protein